MLTSDLALPPFSKFSCIEKKFESKIKKNLLLTFFKFQKMTNFFFLKITLFSIFFFVTFSFSKNFNSKLFFILLSTFFSMHGIFVNEGFHFLTFSKFTSDFALPPFSIFSCIHFFFESKFKKNLLLNFFKFQKMTKKKIL